MGISENTIVEQNFWGVWVVGVGMGVIGLSSLKPFYRGRWGVTAVGLLIMTGGFLYTMFTTPISNIAKGALFLILALAGGGYIHYLRVEGWKLVGGNIYRYISWIILIGIFIMLWTLTNYYYYPTVS